MLEFCYELPYEDLDFTDKETRQLYRIGRGEQGVLLVRPYTNIICAHWRFKTPKIALTSAHTIFDLYLDYLEEKDFIGMDMCRKRKTTPIVILLNLHKYLNVLGTWLQRMTHTLT